MKFLKTTIFYIFFLIIISFSLFSQVNLVRNGDFEQLFKELPVHWSKDAWLANEEVTKYYVESDNPYSGNYYVTIESINNNDARLIQEVVVKPNTIYRLSAWVKAEQCNMERKGANLSVIQPNFFETSKDYKDTNGECKYLEFYLQTGNQQTMTVAVLPGGY